MKDKNYLVLDNEDSHEYDLKVVDTDKGTSFELYFSKGMQWSEHVRGTLAMSLFNDGNGVKINKKIKKLGYDELAYLRLLINFEHITDTNPLNSINYRIIETNIYLEV